MKIVCENCSAKYSIADEKVKGKVFKIRCKKCGESIVVRGDTQEPGLQPGQESDFASADVPRKTTSLPMTQEEEVETKVFDYASRPQGEEEPVWHIVVEGEQQGPYTASQIREYLGAGSLDLETYIWREGFEDWLPIKNVPELSGKPGMSFPSAVAPSEPFPREPAPAGGGLFDAQPGASGGLFGAASGGGLFGGGGLGQGSAAGSPFDTGGGLFSAGGSATPAKNEEVFASTPLAPATGGLFSTEPTGADDGGGLFSQSGDSQAGSDLFGDSAGVGGSVGAPDGMFSSVGAQQPTPRMDAQRMMMTGQRNENSVLFSLSSLQALASGAAMERSSAAPKNASVPPSALNEEVSGLIDIRSLAASLSTEHDSGVDDILSMGAGFAPALGAPILAPQKESMSLGIKIALIGGGVAVLAVIVILLVVLVSKGEDDQTKQQLALLQKQLEEASQAPSLAASTQPTAPKETAQQPEQKGEPAQVEEGDKASQEPQEGEKDDRSGSSSSKGSSSKSGKKTSSTSSSSSQSSSSKASSEESSGGSLFKEEAGGSEPAKPAASKTGGSDELDDLLGGSLAKPDTAPKKESSGGSSSGGGGGGGGTEKKSLDRSDVQQGMAGVADRVKRCGQGQSGSITLKVIIGSTGKVVSANATGSFAGTPIGSCAARAVRAATFPKSQQSLTVMYPFKL